MPLTSRWMPLATILVLGLAVGGVAQDALAGVAAGLAALAAARFGALREII